MASKQGRKSNKKHESTAEIEEAAHFFRFGYLIGCGRSFLADMSHRDRLTYWRRHRAAIQAANSRQCQAAGKLAQRPYPLLLELEARHPRRVVRVEKYWPPWTAAGPPKAQESEPILENDAEYLARLGLLEAWELELIKKRNENGNLSEKKNPDIDKTATP